MHAVEHLFRDDRRDRYFDPLVTRTGFCRSAIATTIVVPTDVSLTGQDRMHPASGEFLVSMQIPFCAQPFYDFVDPKRSGLAVSFKVQAKDKFDERRFARMHFELLLVLFAALLCNVSPIS